MEINFTGKRALVTGASGGIGKSVVENLIKCGAEVVAFDFNQNALSSLRTQNPGVQICCVDLQDWNGTKKAAESCGPIDLLVNCAGILIQEYFGEIQEETLDRMFNTNLKAIINLSQVVVSGMKERNTGGSIVNVSSIGAKRACKGVLGYSASKAAIDIITKTMALELGPYKIRVNSINPGSVNTEMLKEMPADKVEEILSQNPTYPMGRIAEPKDISDVIVYLLSDLAQMVNGVNLTVDGAAYVR